MKMNKIKAMCGGIFGAVLLLCTAACGASADPGTQAGAERAEQSAGTDPAAAEHLSIPDWNNLGEPDPIPLTYAEQFTMDRYDAGYVLITVADRDRFLVVPEGMSAPDGMDEDVAVIQQPLTDIYLVASAVMDMFRSIDGLDAIRLSGTDADGWCMDEVTAAMKEGDILYAGKYNAPDYELILSEGCDLAIENLMIDHSPEVKEELASFGIPVMVDYSSYESHPLGRVEWVKLYGVLLGKEEEAEAAFNGQARILEAVGEKNSGEDPGQEDAATVAFFYITSNGAVNVRKSSDYVPKMIGLAGGTYIFDDLGDADSHSSTVTMQPEEFYAGAKDADYIIYNSTIDGELQTVDELIQKWGLLADFKAVKDGHVYCTTQNLYQESMAIGVMIGDIHKMLGGDGQMQYLYRLED